MTAGDEGSAPHRARRWFHPAALARGLSVRPKLIVASAAALTMLLLAPSAVPASARAVLAWNAGALIYLGLAAHLMSTCTTASIRRRAVREDETRFVFATIILLAVATSFAAVVGLIGEAKTATQAIKAAYLALAGLGIFASWMVMQVVFTLHYAHAYYRPSPSGDGAAAGLSFPDEEDPDYWDFFYFTTSIGATSQTSDVAVASKTLRRTVALQAILSFVFNTTIVALAINLASSML